MRSSYWFDALPAKTRFAALQGKQTVVYRPTFDEAFIAWNEKGVAQAEHISWRNEDARSLDLRALDAPRTLHLLTYSYSIAAADEATADLLEQLIDTVQ